MTGFNSKRQMAADKQHWNEDEWNKNNWRCSHGWLRGEQCEICNAPQREWVGLTEDERNNLWRYVIGWGDPSHKEEDLMKAIEAKLKERNHEH